MNGRVYDYNLGRFLSVDPFIQDPGNSQSMNPYSYIMNNPLAGTDPTGYMALRSEVGGNDKPIEEPLPKVKKPKAKSCSSSSYLCFKRATKYRVTETPTDNGAASLTIGEDAKKLFKQYGATYSSRSEGLGMFADQLPEDQSLFFLGASDVADSFSNLDDIGGPITGTDAETVGFLSGLSKKIFLNAAEIFVRLKGGKQLAFDRGLTGRKLASSILSFEQGITQKALNNYGFQGSRRRNRLVDDINGFSKSPWTEFGMFTNFNVYRALVRGSKNGFNFENRMNRIRVGEALFDIHEGK